MAKLYNSVASTFAALAIPDFSQLAIGNRDYVSFGDTNLLPTYIANLSEISPTHSAIIESKRNFLNGDFKIDITNEKQVKLDRLDLEDIDGKGSTLEEFIDMLNSDSSVYESIYIEVLYNKTKTRIVNLNHIPYNNVRVGKYDEDGIIDTVYVSADWNKKYLKRNRPIPMATFNPKRIETESQVMILRVKRPAQPYYTVPSWMSSVQWILLEDDIAELNRADVTNGFFPSMILNFFNGEPDEDKKAELEGYINKKFKGAKGAKLMMFFSSSLDKKVQLDTFDAPNLGEYSERMIPLVENKILSAHRAPASIIGVSTGTGFSNKADEMDTAFQLYVKNSIIPLQKLIINAFKKVYKFNGVTDVDISFNNQLLVKEEAGKEDALNAEINSEEEVTKKEPKAKDVKPIKPSKDEE